MEEQISIQSHEPHATSQPSLSMFSHTDSLSAVQVVASGRVSSSLLRGKSCCLRIRIAAFPLQTPLSAKRKRNLVQATWQDEVLVRPNCCCALPCACFLCRTKIRPRLSIAPEDTSAREVRATETGQEINMSIISYRFPCLQKSLISMHQQFPWQPNQHPTPTSAFSTGRDPKGCHCSMALNT